MLTKIAWWADAGSAADRDWWSEVLDGGPLRILDVGCGKGASLDLLASLGHEVAGIEPDAVSRRLASSSGHRVLAGTAEDMPTELKAGSFDVILFMHVLEHCLSAEQALQNAMRLLAPGGILVIEVPNNACRGLGFYGVAWNWLDVPRHLNFYTARSLQSIVRDAGYDVVDLAFCGYCRQFGRPWRETQKTIARVFWQKASVRFGFLGALEYYRRTFRARDEEKYDSVRVVARLPE